MIGGLYLCYEGAEKVVHKFWPHPASNDPEQAERVAANADESVDLVAHEKEKIKGAVRTDFILSAEIIVISLGTIAATVPLLDKAATLVAISLLMTVGVYGFVAMIVKIDDLGLHLQQKSSSAAQSIGKALLAFAPILMKVLSIAGTLAMLSLIHI